ncbi:hypothetical protein BRC61_01635 [Halobacteriales archaeon QH_10_65_19]|nr:MAG: hypothetical protein BRC61_01635 [Halobacteriales archaeon QH_10_65_19]
MARHGARDPADPDQQELGHAAHLATARPARTPRKPSAYVRPTYPAAGPGASRVVSSAPVSYPQLSTPPTRGQVLYRDVYTQEI